MIPSNPKDFEKLRELAARNIANGDWGDETTFPGETVPVSPEERNAKGAVSDILNKSGSQKLPKRK
jgi:hypothetical protein